MKMKKNKRDKVDSISKVKHDVSEGIIEIILCAVFLGIGMLVCWGISSIFSIDFSIDMDNFDSDTFIIIGLISLALAACIFGFVKDLIKKVKKRNK